MSEAIKSELRDDCLIITIMIKNLHLENIYQLKSVIDSQLDKAKKKIIINFRKTNYLDSSALGTLWEIKEKVNAVKKSLYLTGINPTIATVMKITKIDKEFNTLNTVAEAIEISE